MLAGPCFLWGLRGESFLPPPALGGCRPSLARGHITHLCLHLLLCVCVFSSVSHKDHLLLDLVPTFIQDDLILNLITSTKTLFLNMVTFSGLEGEDGKHIFLGDTAQLATGTFVVLLSS